MCWVLRIIKCRPGDATTRRPSLQLYCTFGPQQLKRSHVSFYQPLGRPNEWFLHLKTCFCAHCENRVGGRGKVQCLLNAHFVFSTGNGVLVSTQGGNKRANTPALVLQVDGKVANEFPFCLRQPNTHGREGVAELLSHLTLGKSSF